MITWVFISIIIAVIIVQLILFKKMDTNIAGFELLLTKFIEVNQEFYEGQKTVVKKDKELIDVLTKQYGEISVIRRYSTQINTSVRTLSESIKSLKENEKTIKEATDELGVSKQIATSLATVSGNIKLLDKIAMDLKKSIQDLKRRR